MIYYEIKVITSIIQILFYFYVKKAPNKVTDEHTVLIDTNSDKKVTPALMNHCGVLYIGCLIQLLYFWYVGDYAALEMDTQQWVCMVMLFGGISVRKWSYHMLGKHFVYKITVIKDVKLVTTGPYRFIMHPGYSSAITVAISAFLIYGNLAATVAVFVQIAFYGMLAGIEETALTQHLGGGYKKYASERSRFIPFLF